MQSVRAPYSCVCGKAAVDARGLHGLACRRSAPRQQRHSHINDIIWRAMKRAQIPVVKEPVGLMRQDGKRPEGTTILPWSRGRPLAWDVTVPEPTLTLMSSTQPEKREQKPTMQQPTRTPSTASYQTLMCSFRWPLRQGVHGAIRRWNWFRRLEDGRPTLQTMPGSPPVHLHVPAAVRGTTVGVAIRCFIFLMS